MSDRLARLNGPALRAQAETALAAVGTAAMRRAAAHLREESMAIPAPCGCNPTIRCDRHCRVKLRIETDADGRRRWAFECNGRWTVDSYDHSSWCSLSGYHLLSLHKEATEHVTRHRLRAFAHTK